MRPLLRTPLPALCPALTTAGSPITSPPSFPLERACAPFPGAVTFPGACAPRMPSTRWPQWRERRGQRAGLPPAPPHEVGPSLPAPRGTRPARRGSAGAVLPHLGTSDHRPLSSLGSPKQEDSGPSEGRVLLRADSRRNRVCLESRPPPALALSNQPEGKVSPPSTPVLVNAAEMGGGAWDPHSPEDDGPVSWEAPGSAGNDGRRLAPPPSQPAGPLAATEGPPSPPERKWRKELDLRGSPLFQNDGEAGSVRIASVPAVRWPGQGTAVTGAVRLTGHGTRVSSLTLSFLLLREQTDVVFRIQGLVS